MAEESQFLIKIMLLCGSIGSFVCIQIHPLSILKEVLDKLQPQEKWIQSKNKIIAEKIVLDAIMEKRAKEKSSRRIKKACLKIFKFLLSTAGLLVINVIILVLGAFIFKHLEEANEIQVCNNSRGDYYKAENATLLFLMQMAEGFDASGPMKEADRLKAVEQFSDYLKSFALSVLETGYDISEECEKIGEPGGPRQKWSLIRSLVFSLTVITTIGYGDIAPATMWGRLVCIAYALIGIPVFMLALANIGEILANLFRATYSTICCCGCCRKKNQLSDQKLTAADEEYVQKAAAVWRLDPVTGRPIPPSKDIIIEDEFEEKDLEEFEDDEDKLAVPVTITVAAWFTFVLVGASLFTALEGISFLDAFYFSTITATTIGFGDIVPEINDNKDGIVKTVVLVLYIIISMAAISMCFQLIVDEIISKVNWIAEKLGINKTDDDVDGKDKDK